MEQIQTVWIFMGVGAQFPSGVFNDEADARAWISKNHLSGILTQYPVGVSVYDWVVSSGGFKPKKPEHFTPEFIGRFGSPNMPHYHFENGEPC